MTKPFRAPASIVSPLDLKECTMILQRDQNDVGFYDPDRIKALFNRMKLNKVCLILGDQAAVISGENWVQREKSDGTIYWSFDFPEKLDGFFVP